MNLNPNTIWQFAQNKPSLIADDFEKLGINRKTTHAILLARGVYKWFSVRRHLIVLKDKWRKEITDVLSELHKAKIPNNSYRVGYLRGYLAAMTACRNAVRELCHSDRWQAPDFDREAQQFLRELESKQTN